MSWTVVVTGGERGTLYGVFSIWETKENAKTYLDSLVGDYEPEMDGPWFDVVEIKEGNALSLWIEDFI